MRRTHAGNVADTRDDWIELGRVRRTIGRRLRTNTPQSISTTTIKVRSGGNATASSQRSRRWPSGFYAAHISNEAGEDFIPFIVRPRQPQADVVLLVPTFSYEVYGSYAAPARGAEIADAPLHGYHCRSTPEMNRSSGCPATIITAMVRAYRW